MFLEFAETQDAQPMHISRVRPDQRTTLFCPHCRQRVTAHTRSTEHWLPRPHFVHVDKTCHYIDRYDQENHIRIPLYQEFERYSDAQIVAGTLPLADFFKLQQDAMRYIYSVFYDKSQNSILQSALPSYRLTDRKLFEWTIEKCLFFTLYCVELQLTTETIYHIGSSDQLEDAYLERLSKQFPPVDIIYDMRVWLALPHMASLEYYIQHRFRHDRHIFRDQHKLPDYFRFSVKRLEQVLTELQHLRYVTNTRREKILMGIFKARMSGKRIGRPSESPDRFLRKKKSQQIATLLAKGLSAGDIRRRTGCALKTIRKVEALLARQREKAL